MTLAQLRDKADAKLATFWAALVTKQNAYYAKHGKFFQLLVSPETNVVDGADSTFTVRHPSDELYTVDVNFAFAELIPFNIRVDEWVGGTRGFTATVVVELPNGDRYTRSRSYIPQPDDITDPQNPVPVPALQPDSGWSQVVDAQL